MEVKGFCLFKDFSLVEPGESDVQGTSGVSEEFAFFNLFFKYVQILFYVLPLMFCKKV